MEVVNPTMLIECEQSKYLSQKTEIGELLLKARPNCMLSIETQVRFKDTNMFNANR